jgi:exodeoxyribonuclease VII large subunit
MKSQWNFGELFPPEATRRVRTVSEVTGAVKKLLEREIGRIWITGEITNLRLQSSGHLYFTLKDAAAQISCVLFRGEARGFDRSSLEDGRKVVLEGEITVYEPRGQYQLRVLAVELQGIGALQAAFEKLKQKLQSEGLFAPERKRPLPRFPQCAGLVTSPTGAAIRDVIHVVQRRNPAMRLVLAQCRVQGAGAAEEIACALRLLNEWVAAERARPGFDPGKGLVPELILITRGGGSLEDLWAFNEEVVARAIFESELPVVSAVGHEIDFSISDFVADLRAATPSAAAELITEGVFSSREFLAEALRLLARCVRRRLALDRDAAERLVLRLERAHPRRRLQEQAQRVDDLQDSLNRCTRHGLRTHRTRFQAAAQRFALLKPARLVSAKWEALARYQARLAQAASNRTQAIRTRFATAADRLKLLSPGNVLRRGYSITTEMATGKIVRSASNVAPGTRIRTQLHSGTLESVVEP